MERNNQKEVTMKTLKSLKAYRETIGGIWYFTEEQDWTRESDIKKGSVILAAESYEDTSDLKINNGPISRDL